MLKKFIKILICTLMVLSSVCVTGHASDDDVSLLKALGIIRSYDEGGYKTDINLTRGEAAYMVCNLLDIRLDPTGYEIGDKNVNWSQCAVDYLVSNGFLNETNTEKEILHNEYITLLVRALGYKDFAEANGGYPNGYIYAASRIGIVTVSSGDKVTKGEAASMMVSAAQADIAEYNFDGYGSIEFNSGVSALEKYLSVYYDKGQVSANSVTGLETPVGAGEGYIKIDGVTYAVSDKKYDNYLGNNVDFYYRDDDGEYTALWLKVNENRQESVIFDAEDIEKYDNFVYSCYEDNKNVLINISANSDVIYNGKSAQNFDDSIYVPLDGCVEFIDTNSDGVYDVVKITSYTTVVVSSIDVNKEIVYNRIGANMPFGMKDFYIYDENGEKADINDIKQNAVLVFTIALDNSYSQCTFVKNSIEGTIRTIEASGDESHITVDDTSYEVNKAFIKTAYYKPENGQSGVFYLDHKNRIVWIDGEYASVKIGYLYKAFIEESNDAVAGFRILESDGDFVNYYSNGKLMVNSSSYKTAQPVVDIFTKPQIVSYKINSDGNIVRIDSAGTDKDKLHMSVSGQNLYYKAAGQIFGMKMAVNSNTSIFAVPSNGSMNAGDYEAVPLSNLINDISYQKLEGYRIGNKHGALDALVIYDAKANSSINKNSDISYVKSMYDAYDDNDETVKTYLELTGGKSGGFFVDEETDISGIAEGDIVIFNLDSDNEISVMERIYSNKNKIFSTTALKDGLRAAKGYIYYNDGGYITLTGSLPKEADFDENDATIYIGSKFRVYLFDNSKEANMYTSSADELIPYNIAGNNCTEVIIVTLNEEAKYIFEIQK